MKQYFFFFLDCSFPFQNSKPMTPKIGYRDSRDSNDARIINHTSKWPCKILYNLVRSDNIHNFCFFFFQFSYLFIVEEIKNLDEYFIIKYGKNLIVIL